MDWFKKTFRKPTSYDFDNEEEEEEDEESGMGCNVPPTYPLIYTSEEEDEYPHQPLTVCNQLIDVTASQSRPVLPAKTICFVRGLQIVGYHNYTGKPLQVHLNVPDLETSVITIPSDPPNARCTRMVCVYPMPLSARYAPASKQILENFGKKREDGDICVPCTSLPSHGIIGPSHCFRLMYPAITRFACEGLSHMTENAFYQCINTAGCLDPDCVSWNIFSYDGSNLQECGDHRLMLEYQVHTQ